MAWKKTSWSGKRFRQWKNNHGDVINVENPPSGWEVHISTERGDSGFKFKNQRQALIFANKLKKVI